MSSIEVNPFTEKASNSVIKSNSASSPFRNTQNSPTISGKAGDYESEVERLKAQNLFLSGKLATQETHISSLHSLIAELNEELFNKTKLIQHFNGILLDYNIVSLNCNSDIEDLVSEANKKKKGVKGMKVHRRNESFDIRGSVPVKKRAEIGSLTSRAVYSPLLLDDTEGNEQRKRGNTMNRKVQISISNNSNSNSNDQNQLSAKKCSSSYTEDNASFKKEAPASSSETQDGKSNQAFQVRSHANSPNQLTRKPQGRNQNQGQNSGLMQNSTMNTLTNMTSRVGHTLDINRNEFFDSLKKSPIKRKNEKPKKDHKHKNLSINFNTSSPDNSVTFRKHSTNSENLQDEKQSPSDGVKGVEEVIEPNNRTEVKNNREEVEALANSNQHVITMEDIDNPEQTKEGKYSKHSNNNYTYKEENMHRDSNKSLSESKGLNSLSADQVKKHPSFHIDLNKNLSLRAPAKERTSQLSKPKLKDENSVLVSKEELSIIEEIIADLIIKEIDSDSSLSYLDFTKHVVNNHKQIFSNISTGGIITGSNNTDFSSSKNKEEAPLNILIKSLCNFNKLNSTCPNRTLENNSLVDQFITNTVVLIGKHMLECNEESLEKNHLSEFVNNYSSSFEDKNKTNNSNNNNNNSNSSSIKNTALIEGTGGLKENLWEVDIQSLQQQMVRIRSKLLSAQENVFLREIEKYRSKGSKAKEEGSGMRFNIFNEAELALTMGADNSNRNTNTDKQSFSDYAIYNNIFLPYFQRVSQKYSKKYNLRAFKASDSQFIENSSMVGVDEDLDQDNSVSRLFNSVALESNNRKDLGKSKTDSLSQSSQRNTSHSGLNRIFFKFNLNFKAYFSNIVSETTCLLDLIFSKFVSENIKQEQNTGFSGNSKIDISKLYKDKKCLEVENNTLIYSPRQDLQVSPFNSLLNYQATTSMSSQNNSSISNLHSHKQMDEAMNSFFDSSSKPKSKYSNIKDPLKTKPSHKNSKSSSPSIVNKHSQGQPTSNIKINSFLSSLLRQHFSPFYLNNYIQTHTVKEMILYEVEPFTAYSILSTLAHSSPNSSITKLIINNIITQNNNSIGERGEEIYEGLNNIEASSLSFGCNNFGTTLESFYVEKTFECLSFLADLEVVDFSYSCLQDNSIKTLVRNLKHCAHLRSLYINNNSISGLSGFYLAELFGVKVSNLDRLLGVELNEMVFKNTCVSYVSGNKPGIPSIPTIPNPGWESYDESNSKYSQGIADKLKNLFKVGLRFDYNSTKSLGNVEGKEGSINVSTVKAFSELNSNPDNVLAVNDDIEIFLFSNQIVLNEPGSPSQGNNSLLNSKIFCSNLSSEINSNDQTNINPTGKYSLSKLSASHNNNSHSLESLYLSGNKLNSNGLFILAASLTNSNLSQLDISNNKLISSDLNTISYLLLKSRRLQILNISSQKLFGDVQVNEESERIHNFGVALKNSSLKVLISNDVSLNSENSPYLLQHLNESKLEDIYLDNNNIAEIGGVLFANVIKFNNELKKVSLKNCGLNSNSLMCIMHALETAKNLEGLILLENSFDDRSLFNLNKLIGKKQKLKVTYSNKMY